MSVAAHNTAQETTDETVAQPEIDVATRGVSLAKRLFIIMFGAGVLVTLFSGDALAYDGVVAQGSAEQNLQDLRSDLESIVDLLTFIILGIAVPNAAYGFMQYMTAGSNVEQDEQARNRIRNTFIAIAGVAVLRTAVDALELILDVEEDSLDNVDNSSSVISPAYDSFVDLTFSLSTSVMDVAAYAAAFAL